MNNSKLIQLIRESINDYIREIDEAGNVAALEAKMGKTKEAIDLREKKMNMDGLDEAYHDMLDKGKMKELSNEVKALKKSLAKYEKQLDKLKSKSEKSEKVEDTEEKEIVDEVNIDENFPENGPQLEEIALEDIKINESFLYMQKLAGVLSEKEYNEKLEEARFKKGTDIGKKGKGFAKVAKAAAKEYGSKEAGQKVAGAILKKVVKNKPKSLKEEVLALFENEVGGDNDKALGILFHPNDDMEEANETPYVWDHNAYENLVKSMGYEDYEDVAGEMTHYFAPGDNDEMRVMRNLIGNPNLQPTDLTIGMYKKAIRSEYPD